MGKKNITGGNKTRKQKRDTTRYDPILKLEPEQMFAQVTQNHGSHFSVLCSDNISRLGRLSSSLKKGPRITTGTFVVISLRDFEAEKKNCDIIGYGSPPTNILNIFQKINPDATSDFKFSENIENDYDSDDDNEGNNQENNDNKNEDIIWDDI
jgi:initiation factor 1A